MSSEGLKEYEQSLGNITDVTEFNDASLNNKQIGKVAINGFDRIPLLDKSEESIEPNLYDPLDPYGIPDERESLDTLSEIRHNEINYNRNSFQFIEEKADTEDDSYKPIDDFSIPDEPESISALIQTRELEKNYSINPVYNIDSQINRVDDKEIKKISERELDRIAEATGQSPETVLRERHLTWDDVELSPDNK
jgi:hypothetical protein